MIVIKLGGASLKATLRSPELFKMLADFQDDMVIVHGGGPESNLLSEKLGLEVEFVDGQRVTSPEIMEVVEMLLCGKINPALVRGFLKVGRKAFGLSGIDGGFLQCVEENPKLGQVGKVESVRTEYLHDLLKNGVIPVVSPVGLFADGRPCNVNADLAAAKIASTLKADRLLFLTDKDGILDAQGSVIRELSKAQLKELSQTETITGGMRVKARAMLEMLESHPSGRVEVMNGLDPSKLSSGTQVKGA